MNGPWKKRELYCEFVNVTARFYFPFFNNVNKQSVLGIVKKRRLSVSDSLKNVHLGQPEILNYSKMECEWTCCAVHFLSPIKFSKKSFVLKTLNRLEIISTLIMGAWIFSFDLSGIKKTCVTFYSFWFLIKSIGQFTTGNRCSGACWILIILN